ncbi:MAG TPA: hypothetical protein VEU62_16570 [Bryobacterales bacterium]|nr:hypothetical protein [Bryobacterales bacterium]
MDEQEIEKQRQELRAAHRVRPVNEAEDGCGLHRLPNGVYGFTYTPGPHDAPLFQTSRLHNFEIHKCADGTTLLVGFVSPDAAARIAAGRERAAFQLFAAPSAEAAVLVSVPLHSVRLQRGFSTREPGGGLELEFEPTADYQSR